MPINDQVADRIWAAVEFAIDLGTTVEEFKREVAQAWAEKLKQDAEIANRELSKW